MPLPLAPVPSLHNRRAAAPCQHCRNGQSLPWVCLSSDLCCCEDASEAGATFAAQERRWTVNRVAVATLFAFADPGVPASTCCRPRSGRCSARRVTVEGPLSRFLRPLRVDRYIGNGSIVRVPLAGAYDSLPPGRSRWPSLRERELSTHTCLSRISCQMTGVLWKPPFAEFVATIRSW